MSTVNFTAKELSAKAVAALRTIQNIDQLRAYAQSVDGEAYMVERMLFVWVASDKTPDDSLNSVKPTAVSFKSPGRYRRAGLALPLAQK